jgi:RimJ/RimL family protein N-acetyltransferase
MIELRPLTESDLEFLLEVRNDFTTRNKLEDDSVFTLEQCKMWFSSTDPKWYIIKNEGISVGYFRTNGNEVGCDIHPKYRRKGFAKMSYDVYLKNVNNASLWVFDDNFAKKLYESLGFKQTEKSKKIRNRNYIHMLWNRA